MEHKSRMCNKIMEALLLSHFVPENHAPEDIRFWVIYKSRPHPYNHVDVYKILRRLETPWIFKLRSGAPENLNQSILLHI